VMCMGLLKRNGNHQLDLLRWDVARSGMDPQSLRNTTPYNAAAGARHLWNVGEELANGIRTTVVGIVNVNNNHWVAVVVDAIQSTIRYGDSLGGDDAEVKAITRQRDSHSCLIFAVNAAKHFILPAQTPLLQFEAAAEARISMFMHVAQRDLKLVSYNIDRCLKVISIHSVFFQEMEASFSL